MDRARVVARLGCRQRGLTNVAVDRILGMHPFRQQNALCLFVTLCQSLPILRLLLLVLFVHLSYYSTFNRNHMALESYALDLI